MNDEAMITQELETGPKTSGELIELTRRPMSAIRNALSVMYFKTSVIGCDTKGRYHLLGKPRLNGALVLRHRNGRDMPA